MPIRGGYHIVSAAWRALGSYQCPLVNRLAAELELRADLQRPMLAAQAIQHEAESRSWPFCSAVQSTCAHSFLSVSELQRSCFIRLRHLLHALFSSACRGRLAWREALQLSLAALPRLRNVILSSASTLLLCFFRQNIRTFRILVYKGVRTFTNTAAVFRDTSAAIMHGLGMPEATTPGGSSRGTHWPEILGRSAQNPAERSVVPTRDERAARSLSPRIPPQFALFSLPLHVF